VVWYSEGFDVMQLGVVCCGVVWYSEGFDVMQLGIV